MYLRRNRKKANDAEYDYWTLVESVRTSQGPRQRIVASIGKVPGLDKKERVGWETIKEALAGKGPLQGTLFEDEVDPPEWAHVNVQGVQVERLRQFGDVYLGLLLWKKLRLDDIFEELERQGREQVQWAIMYCIATIARFCHPSSDLAISENWYEKTALEDLLGVSPECVNETRLYRTLDHILLHKDDVCKHLQHRYQDLFGTDFEFLLYDVTSTYFEGQAKGNAQAQRGYSRDKRPDCPQVCIGLVVTIEGLPVGYEVFAGNRADVTTLEEMVELMEGKYGKANRIWVFDRGIVSEDNLDYLTQRGAQYVVGTPKSLLKKFETALFEKEWEEVEKGVEVKLLKHPEYGEETFILCQSEERKQKERGILERSIQRLEDELKKIQGSIKKGYLKDRSKAERRIGRWMGRYARAEKLFDVELVYEGEQLVDLKIRKKREHAAWAQEAYGRYLLRTNIQEKDPRKLWKIYMQLTQAENAFRMSKSDLGLRPVHHQKEHRVQAHIFICFLALAMWKSLELWMDSKGLGKSPKKLLQELREIRLLDVLLPVKDQSIIRLRVVARPEEHVQVLLHKMGIKIPNQTKYIQNVVEKIGA